MFPAVAVVSALVSVAISLAVGIFIVVAADHSRIPASVGIAIIVVVRGTEAVAGLTVTQSIVVAILIAVLTGIIQTIARSTTAAVVAVITVVIVVATDCVVAAKISVAGSAAIASFAPPPVSRARAAWWRPIPHARACTPA